VRQLSRIAYKISHWTWGLPRIQRSFHVTRFSYYWKCIVTYKFASKIVTFTIINNNLKYHHKKKQF
jgi:hypothetical protein